MEIGWQRKFTINFDELGDEFRVGDRLVLSQDENIATQQLVCGILEQRGVLYQLEYIFGNSLVVAGDYHIGCVGSTLNEFPLHIKMDNLPYNKYLALSYLTKSDECLRASKLAFINRDDGNLYNPRDFFDGIL
jgi:hypothetical protein